MSGQNARRSIAERRAAHETAFFDKIKFNLRICCLLFIQVFHGTIMVHSVWRKWNFCVGLVMIKKGTTLVFWHHFVFILINFRHSLVILGYNTNITFCLIFSLQLSPFWAQYDFYPYDKGHDILRSTFKIKSTLLWVSIKAPWHVELKLDDRGQSFE